MGERAALNSPAAPPRSAAGLGLKAMVLAAGAGTRLRPLTTELPKPLMPIANRPVIHHVIENLARHGVRDVMMNLWSHPDLVRASCGDGSRWGLRISYSQERALLGTAGAVKKVEGFFRGGPFLIMSGDGLSDVDLTALARFHRRRRSFATMVTNAVDARFEYGVARVGPGGRIAGFLEKPRLGRFFSNQANTGIYLFEPGVFRHIPMRFYDFGHELWPKLLRLKKPIHAWEWKGVWCDVGNLVEFRKSQLALLDGKTSLSVPGHKRRDGIWVEDGARIHPKAVLKAPCAIGAGASIGPRAVVGPWTVLGAGSRISANAALKNCILFDDAFVGSGAFLTNCIVGAGCAVAAKAAVYNGELLRRRIS